MSEMPDTPAIKMTVSMALSSARTEMGLSQKDVADVLFLNLAFVKNIDDDEIDKISKKAFIKGYLRSYAKLVNLDPDAVIELYSPGVAREESVVPKQTTRPDAISKISFTGPVLISGIVGLVCLALIVVLVWYFAGEEDDVPVVTSSPRVSQEAPKDIPEQVEDSFQEFDSPTSIAEQNTDTAVINDFAESNTSESNAIDANQDELVTSLSESSSTDSLNDVINNVVDKLSAADASEDDIEDDSPAIVIQRSTSGLTNYISVNAGSGDDLNFVFTDDCWLEVEDATGKSIFGDLGRAGDDLTITGQAPFRLLVGKPNVITVTYNGDDVDLKPFITPARTAKLVLGNS
ncbi:MAG: cytoskeleton protein RodZ [Candidatus Azotimanducaceae bacterium]|jgi:cytoskeleton protein RodZ